MAIDVRSLTDTWQIGSVEIPSRIVLAPMAGVSVQAFRRQGRRFGAGLVCSEMVSACGLGHQNERTMNYLRISRDEKPLAVQIFGSDPALMADAARMCVEAGADLIDINMGCPVRKVTKTGAGATLISDGAERGARVVAAVAEAAAVAVASAGLTDLAAQPASAARARPVMSSPVWRGIDGKVVCVVMVGLRCCNKGCKKKRKGFGFLGVKDWRSRTGSA